MISREEKRLKAAFVLALAATGCSRSEPANEVINSIDGSSKADGGEASTTPSEGGTDGGGGACARTGYTPVVMDLCADFWRMPCGLPDAEPSPGNCFLSINDCNRVCEGFFYNCRTIDDSCLDGSIQPDPDGGLQIECSWCIGGPGRAPSGLAPARFDRTVAGYFARAAWMEAASVHAFRTLERELRMLGAPVSLQRAARRARTDEVRHARVMTRIARRHGAPVVKPRVRRSRARSIEAIAVENMAHGCVGETYAALEACHQAERAPAELRADLRRIAKDEIRHAALAWAVARWLDERLTTRARARVAAAKAEAIARLEQEPPVLGAGLPGATTRKALIDALRRSIW